MWWLVPRIPATRADAFVHINRIIWYDTQTRADEIPHASQPKSVYNKQICSFSRRERLNEACSQGPAEERSRRVMLLDHKAADGSYIALEQISSMMPVLGSMNEYSAC